MKNKQCFHKWQFQSLNFQNLSKSVPEHLFWKKSQPKSLENQKLSQLVPGWKVSKVYKISPWTLQSCQKLSLGLKFWKISIMVLVLLNFGRNGPWMKSLENLHVWSLKFQNWQKWSLEISKMEKSNEVLVLFTLGRNHPWNNSGVMAALVPQNSAKYKFGPWANSTTNQTDPLLLFKPNTNTTQTKPTPIQSNPPFLSLWSNKHKPNNTGRTLFINKTPPPKPNNTDLFVFVMLI
jgi:hypothetical protein